MRFRAVKTTPDGRIKMNGIYWGSIVMTNAGLRIVVFDDQGQWTTFDPLIFIPSPT